jgi:hypothetical protein
VNWAYVPISGAITCDSLFGGINTTGINVYGKSNCFGRSSGIGFDGGGNILNPNEGYLIIDTLRDDDITFSFSVSSGSGTLTFDAASGVNWAYIPISGPTPCDTVFNGINTTGINVYGKSNCFGRADGIGFDGGGNQLLPYEGYLIIDTLRDDVLVVPYSI